MLDLYCILIIVRKCGARTFCVALWGWGVGLANLDLLMRSLGFIEDHKRLRRQITGNLLERSGNRRFSGTLCKHEEFGVIPVSKRKTRYAALRKGICEIFNANLRFHCVTNVAKMKTQSPVDKRKYQFYFCKTITMNLHLCICLQVYFAGRRAPKRSSGENASIIG